MMETDLIVVGAGLAGSLLAVEAGRLGLSVTLFDDPAGRPASAVAAGVMNPVGGLRLAPVPDALRLIATAREVFDEAAPGVTRDLSLFRGYTDESERVLKTRRETAAEGAKLFGADISGEKTHPNLNAPHDGFMILGAARADMPAFLKKTHAAFGGKLHREAFAHAELIVRDDGVSYRGIRARRIVFAEGSAVRNNPYFRDRAWRPTKGEFIICEIPEDAFPRHAVKLGLMAVPESPGRWIVGAGTDRLDLSPEPTNAGRESLLAGFRAMFRTPPTIRVLEHRAGIRPAAEGAKPIIGAHPEFPAIHVFNGFGARGCLRAPTLAKNHAAFLAEEISR